jgi:succinoglycan biosynthesis protein ExoM
MSVHRQLVSIVIPTLNREMPLRRALASVAKQVIPDDLSLEVVVVDNSADRSALWVSEDTSLGTENLPVRYVSEPRPGVANARNAGIVEARGEWIAFLDDDEEAVSDWIALHMENLRSTGADASFGPVEAVPEEGKPSAALLGFFSREIDRPDGADITNLAALLGTNNSVFSKDRCLAGAAVFDTTLNETGGEDSLLLQQLVNSGRRFAWAAWAGVHEWVPPRRLDWSYVARRRFLSGQIRTFVQHKLSPPRWHKVLFWMAAGVVQIPIWFLASLVLAPVDREKSKQAHSKAWGGIGKVFWARRFRPRLYGSGLVS